MALMTGEQYIESLRKLKTKVYLFGQEEKNWVDHPIIRPSINSVKITYDLAKDPCRPSGQSSLRLRSSRFPAHILST